MNTSDRSSLYAEGMNQNLLSEHLKTSQILLTAGIIITLTALIFGGYLLLALGLRITGETVSSTLPYAILLFSVLVPVALLILRRKFGLGWGDLGVVRPSKRLVHLFWQIPAAFVVVVTVQVLFVTLVLGGQNPTGSSSVDDMSGIPFASQLALFISMAVLTPFWEELFFRGFLWNWLSRSLSPVVVVVLTALVFAVCHGVPVLLPYMVTVGLCLGYLRWFHRSIWGSLAFHMVLNTMISGVALLAVAG